MIITIRHDDNLKWGNRLVIAPRKFEMEGKTYYVHILDGYCTKVLLFIKVCIINNDTRVAIINTYKTYANIKGLYFNFNKQRVYICD